MALDFANTAGNLFNRIGRFGKLASQARTFQATLKTYFDAILSQYDSSVSSPLQQASDGIATTSVGVRESASMFMDSIKSNAESTIIEMVKADKPTSANSLKDAIYEVYQQMVAGSKHVKLCAVTASAAAAGSNSGDGVCVVSEKRGDGRSQELMIPEASYIRCVSDSQTGGATVGEESFLYIGEPATETVWSPSYPVGPGVTTSITAIKSSVDAAAGTDFGNMLQNSDFEDFTSNLPDGWVAVTGTAGVDFQKGLTLYDSAGAASLQFIGSATNTCLSQAFSQAAASSGSLGVLLPLTSYAVNFWGKTSNTPAAGVLTVELVDGNNTVINDAQGVANSFTVSLTSIGTTFVPKSGVFRMPKSVPSVVKIRLRLSTALSTGTNFFVDNLAMGRLTGTYDGGSGVAIFSGAAKFAADDYYTLTTTNDFGGASNLDTFQWLFDRLFDLRSMGILLPSNASPTQADTMITS